MSDIRQALQGIPEPDRSVGLLLIAFYEQMKVLEKDAQMGGKQATVITMAINDINAAHRTNLVKWLDGEIAEAKELRDDQDERDSDIYDGRYAAFKAVKAHIEG